LLRVVIEGDIAISDAADRAYAMWRAKSNVRKLTRFNS
jgi:hypothetical protein